MSLEASYPRTALSIPLNLYNKNPAKNIQKVKTIYLQKVYPIQIKILNGKASRNSKSSKALHSKSGGGIDDYP